MAQVVNTEADLLMPPALVAQVRAVVPQAMALEATEGMSGRWLRRAGRLAAGRR